MSTESLILFDNTISDSSASVDFIYTDKSKGAGYHKRQDNLHTAMFVLNDYSGEIKMQGTLVLYPGEGDWVDIDNTTFTFTEATPQTFSVNFRGNFVWIRAAFTVLSGSVSQIRYNY